MVYCHFYVINQVKTRSAFFTMVAKHTNTQKIFRDCGIQDSLAFSYFDVVVKPKDSVLVWNINKFFTDKRILLFKFEMK